MSAAEIIAELPKLEVRELEAVNKCLAQLLRSSATQVVISNSDLSRMASDAQIQGELRAISAEFGMTECDGLERR